MEPSADELNQIDTLDSAFDCAGVANDVRTALKAGLGNPTKIRDIIFVARQVWDTVVARTKGKGTAEPDGTVPDRDLSAVDLSRVEIFRRVCFRRVGATPDTPGHMGPPTPAVAAAPPAPVTGQSPSRKLKMSSVVDQTLDAEVQPLAIEAINEMYKGYKAKFGDVPSPESEPTGDQLSAVRQLVQSKANPCIDFAVFGPISLNSQGEWQRKEMPGPPGYESWFQIFRCVRTTFLLLESISAERMDAYAEHIRQLSLRFGPNCWDLVYTADVHMRSEQFERIRRRLHEQPQFGYSEAAPWSAVASYQGRCLLVPRGHHTSHAETCSGQVDPETTCTGEGRPAGGSRGSRATFLQEEAQEGEGDGRQVEA